MRPGRSQTAMTMKLSTCLRPVRKSQNFQFWFPLPGNYLLFFRWILSACVVPMSRLQPRPIWNAFVYTFIPVWIHADLKSVGPAGGMTWDRFELLLFQFYVKSIINNTMTEAKWSRFDIVPVSCKQGLYNG
jgi:hypothetical protein